MTDIKKPAYQVRTAVKNVKFHTIWASLQNNDGNAIDVIAKKVVMELMQNGASDGK